MACIRHPCFGFVDQRGGGFRIQPGFGGQTQAAFDADFPIVATADAAFVSPGVSGARLIFILAGMQSATFRRCRRQPRLSSEDSGMRCQDGIDAGGGRQVSGRQVSGRYQVGGCVDRY
jgi:hypothetical protein